MSCRLIAAVNATPCVLKLCVAGNRVTLTFDARRLDDDPLIVVDPLREQALLLEAG